MSHKCPNNINHHIQKNEKKNIPDRRSKFFSSKAQIEWIVPPLNGIVLHPDAKKSFSNQLSSIWIKLSCIQMHQKIHQRQFSIIFCEIFLTKQLHMKVTGEWTFFGQRTKKYFFWIFLSRDASEYERKLSLMNFLMHLDGGQFHINAGHFILFGLSMKKILIFDLEYCFSFLWIWWLILLGHLWDIWMVLEWSL